MNIRDPVLRGYLEHACRVYPGSAQRFELLVSDYDERLAASPETPRLRWNCFCAILGVSESLNYIASSVPHTTKKVSPT